MYIEKKVEEAVGALDKAVIGGDTTSGRLKVGVRMIYLPLMVENKEFERGIG